MRVALTDTDPDPDGSENRTGTFIRDYMYAVAEYADWNCDFVTVAWADALEMMKDGRLDVMLDVTRTAEREKWLNFSSESMGTEMCYLFGRAGTALQYEDFASFEGMAQMRRLLQGLGMRRDDWAGRCLAVHIRSNLFEESSRQRQLPAATNGTDELYRAACALFDELWDGATPLRQLGVQVTKLSRGEARQCSFFDPTDYERLGRLDAAVDAIRDKFGEDALLRATFLKSRVASMRRASRRSCRASPGRTASTRSRSTATAA